MHHKVPNPDINGQTLIDGQSSMQSAFSITVLQPEPEFVHSPASLVKAILERGIKLNVMPLHHAKTRGENSWCGETIFQSRLEDYHLLYTQTGPQVVDENLFAQAVYRYQAYAETVRRMVRKPVPARIKPALPPVKYVPKTDFHPAPQK
ncbi:MAG: hypothetical protein JKY49_00770 [Cohaesibacteraceae bacterium]|nr:hypothetical protein [Cohaesibacteraceae bacterium]